MSAWPNGVDGIARKLAQQFRVKWIANERVDLPDVLADQEANMLRVGAAVYGIYQETIKNAPSGRKGMVFCGFDLSGSGNNYQIAGEGVAIDSAGNMIFKIDTDNAGQNLSANWWHIYLYAQEVDDSTSSATRRYFENAGPEGTRSQNTKVSMSWGVFAVATTSTGEPSDTVNVGGTVYPAVCLYRTQLAGSGPTNTYDYRMEMRNVWRAASGEGFRLVSQRQTTDATADFIFESPATANRNGTIFKIRTAAAADGQSGTDIFSVDSDGTAHVSGGFTSGGTVSGTQLHANGEITGGSVAVTGAATAASAAIAGALTADTGGFVSATSSSATPGGSNWLTRKDYVDGQLNDCRYVYVDGRTFTHPEVDKGAAGSWWSATPGGTDGSTLYKTVGAFTLVNSGSTSVQRYMSSCGSYLRPAFTGGADMLDSDATVLVKLLLNSSTLGSVMTLAGPGHRTSGSAPARMVPGAALEEWVYFRPNNLWSGPIVGEYVDSTRYPVSIPPGTHSVAVQIALYGGTWTSLPGNVTGIWYSYRFWRGLKVSIL